MLFRSKAEDKRFVREFTTDLGRDIDAELTVTRAKMIKPDKYLEEKTLYGPGNGLTRQDFQTIYASYTTMKRSQNKVDFGDYLEFAIDMLEGMDDIRSKVQSAYGYFYIDEYQDIDPVQAHLLNLVRGESKYLSVVGDPRQTIYSFKGSEPKFLVDFEKYHPGAVSVELIKNYRSTSSIVDQANRLMLNTSASGGAKGELESVKGAGTRPTIDEYEFENHELAGLVSKINRLQNSEGITPGEIAILARTKANIAIIRTYLGKAGIETKSPEDSFWEDAMPLINRSEEHTSELQSH